MRSAMFLKDDGGRWSHDPRPLRPRTSRRRDYFFGATSICIIAP